MQEKKKSAVTEMGKIGLFWYKTLFTYISINNR